MRDNSPVDSLDMALGVLLWLCTLPVVIFVVLPWFGVEAAVTVAALLLLLVLIVCWGLCYWNVFQRAHKRP